MPYTLFIGLRYLRAKRRERVHLADHRHLPRAGVAIGVMTLERRAGGDDRLRRGPARPHPRASRRTCWSPATARRSPDDRELVARCARAAGRRRRGAVRARAGDAVERRQHRRRACCAASSRRPGGAIDFARHLRIGQHRRPRATDARAIATASAHGRCCPASSSAKSWPAQLDVQPGDPVNLVSPVAIPTAIGAVPKVQTLRRRRPVRRRHGRVRQRARVTSTSPTRNASSISATDSQRHRSAHRRPRSRPRRRRARSPAASASPTACATGRR